MFSLLPRKFRVFVSKVVGKIYKKCKRKCKNLRQCDWCKVDKYKRRRERKKRKDPEFDLRRDAIKKSYVRQAKDREEQIRRENEIRRLERRRKIPENIAISPKKIHWKHKFGEDLRRIWVKILNISINLNCFKP